MTREYFNTRYEWHTEQLRKNALRNNLDEARKVYAQICELCSIAYELNTLTEQEYLQLQTKAEDCFYNSL